MKNFIQTVLMLIAVLNSAAGAENLEYAQVGETVTLKCPGLKPTDRYVYWKFGERSEELAWINYLGGKKITTDEHWSKKLSLSADSLTIANVEQEDFGTFLCEAGSTGPNRFVSSTRLLKLEVLGIPPSPLLPKEPLSLTCKPETPQGDSETTIYWLNPQGSNSDQNVSRPATNQDNGDWTCVVKNKKYEKQTKISVTVVDLSPGPSLVYTSKSTSLTIPCSIPSSISWEQIKAKDIQDVYWQFIPKISSGLPSNDPQRLYVLSLEGTPSWKTDQSANRNLRPVERIPKRDLSLTRKQGTDEDRGDYVCTMKFKNGLILNRTVHVEVLQIVSFPGTDVISGQPLNLTCGLGHPLTPDLQLKWSAPPRMSLPSANSDHLSFPEVGKVHGGKWGCALWQNTTRLTFDEITLKIEPILSVWMLVIICSAAVIVILLLVLVFILCRRRQRKTRHLRHRLCHCKNPKPKGFYRT